MRKFTTKFTEIYRKLALLKLSVFIKKQKLSVPFISATTDRRLENNGERWFHSLPETGEGHLAISLYQFELERAKAIAVA